MPPKAAQKAAIFEDFARSVEDPAYFVREILGEKDLWPVQIDILRSAMKNRDTAVPSCHGSGKTYVAAAVTLAWLTLHPPHSAMVVITSSDFTQVELQIFPYMHAMIGRSRLSFRPDRVNVDGVVNKVGISFNGNVAIGRTTDNTSAFHGFHARYILVIRDEFAGIDPGIIESMRGMRAGGHVSFLDLMNPTLPAGPSVDRCKDPKVNVIRIDGLETPNMDGYHIYETVEANESDPDKAHNILYIPEDELDDIPYPDGRIDRRFIKEFYLDEMEKYAGALKPESSWWPKIRGRPPTAGDSMLLQADWVSAAHHRVAAPESYDVVGCDVAGPGEDETAACHRSGMKIMREMAWPGEVNVRTFKEWVGPPRPNLMINIDRQGVGWGWYQDLRDSGYHVNGLNAGDAAWDRSRFRNAKAEMYWNVRARFKDGEIAGPIDPKTQHQLVNVEWNQDNDKRLIDIETKKEARKRGKRSPDRAEAVILAYAASPLRSSAEWRYTGQPAKRGEKGHRIGKWADKMREARRKAGLIA